MTLVCRRFQERDSNLIYEAETLPDCSVSSSWIHRPALRIDRPSTPRKSVCASMARFLLPVKALEE